MNLQNTFNTERFKNPTARLLYRFAWGFEIIAALLGLLISLAIFRLAYKGAKSVDPDDVLLLNAFIAFAPFFMVALSELAKIPIAEAAFTAKRRLWSFVFGCALLFLAIITFETVFNALEQNFTFRKFKIDAEWTQLQEIKSNVADYGDKVENLEQLTIETINQQYESRIAELTKQREDSLRVINARIDKLDAESGLDAVKELRSRRERKIAERYAEVAKGISAANQRELERLADDMRKKDSEIQGLRKDRVEISVFKRSDRRTIDENIKRLQQERENLEREVQRINQTAVNASQIRISGLDKEINELDERIGQAVGRADDEVRKKRTPLEREAEQIRAKFSDEQKAADQRRDTQVASLTDNENQIKELDGKKDEKIASQRELENNINKLALGVQVYRFALYLAGEREAHKLEPKYVTIVALIWFGSLSAVVALTGVMLAFGAFVIEYGVAKENNRPQYARKLLNSMRRALLPMRKFKRREKVITKVITETVPKEVLVKEIVHVPVLVGGEHKVKTELSTLQTGQVDAVGVEGSFEKPSERSKE